MGIVLGLLCGQMSNLLGIFFWISARIPDTYRVGQMQGINGTNTPQASSRMNCGAAFNHPHSYPISSPTLILSLIPKITRNRTDIPPDIYPETIPTTTTPKTGRVFYRFRVGRTDLRNLWNPPQAMRCTWHDFHPMDQITPPHPPNMLKMARLARLS